MTLDHPFIEQKLELIAEYAKRLSAVLVYSESEIIADFYKLHTLERLVQLIVDEMVDINTHVIRRSDVRTPDDFQSTFMALADAEIFPREFAVHIAPSVGLRNRLVHRYETIDPTLLIHMAKEEMNDFQEYIKYIEQALGQDIDKNTK